MKKQQFSLPDLRSKTAIATMLLFCIGTDQGTKVLARRFMDGGGEVSLAGDLLRLSLVKNHYGFLGIATGLSELGLFIFLYITVALLLFTCLAYLFFCRPSQYTTPLMFITGGGLSNLTDRLLHQGGVTDFISIGLGNFRTGIFNLADVYILAGSFVVGCLYLSPTRKTL
ncbi:MAG: signal peptidase II [Desulforhopalus sp.]